MYIFKDFIDYTILNRSSEATGIFPVSNIKLYDQQCDWVWKGLTIASDHWVVIDLLSPTALKGIAILNTNLSVIRIQGNATDSWATPSFNLLINPVYSEMRKRWNFFVTPTMLSTFNFRYLRIFSPAGTILNGSDPLPFIGAIPITTDVVTFYMEPRFPATMTPRRATRVINLQSGRKEKFLDSLHFSTEINMSLHCFRNTTDFAMLMRNFFNTGLDESVVIAFDKGEVDVVDDGAVFIVKKESEAEYRINTPGYADTDLVLEEQF